MTMEYEAPGDRIRSIGSRVMSGGLVDGGELVSRVQDNIQFRISTARSMLGGGDVSTSMSPVERRREIRERRVALLDAARSNSSANVSTQPGDSSGQITDSGTTTVSSDPGSREDSTPTMSEVDTGTKKRAEERGYGS